MAKLGKRKHIRQLIRSGTSSDPKYLASCYGKIRRDKQNANAEATSNPDVKAYKCKYCEWYHIGRRYGN